MHDNTKRRVRRAELLLLCLLFVPGLAAVVTAFASLDIATGIIAGERWGVSMTPVQGLARFALAMVVLVGMVIAAVVASVGLVYVILRLVVPLDVLRIALRRRMGKTWNAKWGP